jgi:C4-dicarboxylate-specific signal transduction histidine kinase
MISVNAKTVLEHEKESFQSFMDELAAAFVRVPAPDVDGEIDNWLRRLVEFFDADRDSLAELMPQGLLVTHSWARPGYELATGTDEAALPWLAARLRLGELFVFSSPDEIPAEAVNERLLAQRLQIKAHVSIPLMVSGSVIGSLGIACIRRSRQWPAEILQQIRLIGTVFGNALSRKRAVQEYLRLSRALEHAGRVAAMGQLASSFAHEINQPLGASLTNAQTALRLLDEPQPDLAEVRAALEDIAGDNRRAGDIVHELRRFLRKQEPSFTTIAVAELFEAVARFVAPEARSQGVEVRVDAADGLPEVLADRVQIQQVFVNLLLNSFDALYAEPPGQRRVVLAAAPAPSDRVAVSVSDSGPGVPEHLRSGMFEPFVTTKPEGLGIGLAIAQTIVTAHGGRLAYSDARDGGAVFAFTLAVAAQEVHGD